MNRINSSCLTGFWLNFKSSISYMVAALFIVFLIWASLPHLWIMERLDRTPWFFVGFWGLLALPALFSAGYAETAWRGIKRVVFSIYSSLNRKPILTTFFIFVLSSFLCWFFRIRHLEAGDMYQFHLAAVQKNAFYVPHAPLESLIRILMNKILYIWPSLDMVTLNSLLMCVYGGLYVIIVIILARRLPNPYTWLVPPFLICTPVMEIFCGYLEVYSFPVVIEVLFLLVGLLYSKRRCSITTVSIIYGLAFAVALWHAFLFPAYVFLLGVAWWRKEIRIMGFIWQGIVATTIVLIILAILSFYTDPFIGFTTRLGDASLLIPLSPMAKAKGYELFSMRHYADKANEILLIGLAGATIVVVRILTEFKSTFRLCFKPDVVFLGLASLFGLIATFLYYPQLGFPLDWDLYTFLFPCLTLLGVSMMPNLFRSIKWKKIVLILLIISAGLGSAWVLQNALFWHYPATIQQMGPYLSTVMPDYYYKHMQNSFKNNTQNHLYWIADRALEESPERYRDILEFMNEWVITTLAKSLPAQYDDAGWARDMYIQRGQETRVFIFDKMGRIFIKDEETLDWIYSPIQPLPSLLTAGEITSDGDALLLTKAGQLYHIKKSTLDQGMEDKTVWDNPELVKHFSPEAITAPPLPVHLIDMEIHSGNGHICVLDNMNRVWDMETETLLLQGISSYNTAIAFQFTQNHQPVTININNQLSYDKRQVRFPFRAQWFNPIVRDLLLTNSDEGLITLDLNGNTHYSGDTSLYENNVTTPAIIDRFIKIKQLPSRESLLLLDNRYRLYTIELDMSGVSIHSRMENMIQAGQLSQAYKHLRRMWRRSSELTSVCYDLVNTDFIRKARGVRMFESFDEIPLFVDVFPINERLIILLDRWGRLVYDIAGKSFMLDGSGLYTWPQYDVRDGTLVEDGLLFLCTNGQVWHYPSVSTIYQNESLMAHRPTKWIDLNDFERGALWIGVESLNFGREVVALSSTGVLLRIDTINRRLIEKVNIPTTQNMIYKYDCRQSPDGLVVAFSSQGGPPYLYTHWNREVKAVPHSKFDWDAVADIRLLDDNNVLVMDRFGVLHPSDAPIKFHDTLSTPIADAISIKMIPGTEKAIWLRSNGDRRIFRKK